MNEQLLRKPNKNKGPSRDKFIHDLDKGCREKNSCTWDSLDPNAEHDKNVRGSTVNLKFNEWELEVFRHLAKQEKRNLQSYLLLTLKKHALKKVKSIDKISF